jgi:phytoene dehydrogenase-like protein
VPLVANVVVVGAGVAGMAAAARLAKRGHSVVVCEKQPAAGGIIQRAERAGFGWDAGPAAVTLPAVLRDLFRKSGRPLERYVDLQMREVARRHVFADGTSVDLPTGSRGAQIAAINRGLGTSSDRTESGQQAGLSWAQFVDAQAEVWELLRHDVLDDPGGGERLADKGLARRLRSTVSLATAVEEALDDPRLRLMAVHGVVAAGSDPRQVPAWAAVEPYVERAFGVWDVPAGLADLTTALVTRLSERHVDLRLECEVTDIITRGGTVTGVRTARGLVAADAVVTTIDPRFVLDRLVDDRMRPARLATSARRAFAKATPAVPPAVVHLGLRGPLPALPAEVVFHGDPLLTVTTRGSAPAGGGAWTIQSRGLGAADALDVLAHRGLDIRERVELRIDRSPSQLAEPTGGSSYGFAWSGWRDHARRSAHLNPITGLYLAGAFVHPGASVPYAAWGAAHAAARIDQRLPAR